jgi:hypothetical protein
MNALPSGRRQGLTRGLLFLLPALLAVGCGRTGTVSGKVTYQGKNLTAGSVVLETPKGEFFSGPIGEDGTYTVSKVPPGDVKVAVQTPPIPQRGGPPGGSGPPKGAKLGPPPGANAPPDVDPKLFDPASKTGKAVPIPDKYHKSGTSGLTLTVTGGKQEHNIDLP